jgi:hypothetical protein
MNIEEEWKCYLLSNGNNGLLYPSISSHTNKNDGPFQKLGLLPTEEGGQEEEEEDDDDIHIEPFIIEKGITLDEIDIEGDGDGDTDPICEELSISTKTKVLFLNNKIDIHKIFWDIPIIEYGNPIMGIVKKQIKLVSNTPEEYEIYKMKLTGIPYYVEHIIKQINNIGSRTIKFKDERKITIGISKKDIMTTRAKTKNAFYNCFALIYRIPFENSFREIHVKVFNTGKLEIPGVLNAKLLEIVKENLLELIQPHIETPLEFVELNKDDIILINSNFNCGYYINRDKLYAILRGPKYEIETAFDPCTYPGVKCTFYFNREIGFDYELQRGQINREDRDMKMSELEDNAKYVIIKFMVFRTGSCLVVGNCSEEILKFVYGFIKRVLNVEYQNIHMVGDDSANKVKKIKIKKKMVEMTGTYYSTVFV